MARTPWASSLGAPARTRPVETTPRPCPGTRSPSSRAPSSPHTVLRASRAPPHAARPRPWAKRLQHRVTARGRLTRAYSECHPAPSASATTARRSVTLRPSAYAPSALLPPVFHAPPGPDEQARPAPRRPKSHRVTGLLADSADEAQAAGPLCRVTAARRGRPLLPSPPSWAPNLSTAPSSRLRQLRSCLGPLAHVAPARPSADADPAGVVTAEHAARGTTPSCPHNTCRRTNAAEGPRRPLRPRATLPGYDHRSLASPHPSTPAARSSGTGASRGAVGLRPRATPAGGNPPTRRSAPRRPCRQPPRPAVTAHTTRCARHTTVLRAPMRRPPVSPCIMEPSTNSAQTALLLRSPAWTRTRWQASTRLAAESAPPSPHYTRSTGAAAFAPRGAIPGAPDCPTRLPPTGWLGRRAQQRPACRHTARPSRCSTSEAMHSHRRAVPPVRPDAASQKPVAYIAAPGSAPPGSGPSHAHTRLPEWTSAPPTIPIALSHGAAAARGRSRPRADSRPTDLKGPITTV